MPVSFRELNIECLPWLSGEKAMRLTEEQVKDCITSGWSMEDDALYALTGCRKPDADGSKDD